MAKRPTKVSVRELKNGLSAYLRIVQRGGELVVTSRGEPIARLVPSVPARESDGEVLERLRGLPFIRPGRGGPMRASRRPTPWKPGAPLISDIIGEQRE